MKGGDIMPNLQALLDELADLGAKAKDIFLPASLYDQLIDEGEDTVDQEED